MLVTKNMGKPKQPYERVEAMARKVGLDHILKNGAPKNILTPVVAIPGVGGSQLYAQLNITASKHWYCQKQQSWYMIWLALTELTPGPASDCWSDDITMSYNATEAKFYNASGVDIEVWKPWTTLGFEYLDPAYKSETIYFAGVVNSLLAVGYERGKNLFGGPYDWRLAPSSLGDYYVGLQSVIENAYYTNNNTRVAVVAHSMGTMMFLTMLQKMPQAWKDKFIKNFIAISPPWTGAFEGVTGITSGYDFSIPFMPLETACSVQRSFESNYFLMPRPAIWGDYVVINSPTRNYTTNDYPALFQALNLTYAEQIFNVTNAIFDPTIPPNVNTFCFYGYNLPTNVMMTFGKGGFSKQPTITYGDGDGTVPHGSLTYCEKWMNKMPNSLVVKGYEGQEHVDILNDKAMLTDMLSAILS